MDNRRFILTHYFPEPTKHGFLKPLGYFCAVEEKGTRYYVQGQNLKIQFEERKIKQWVKDGIIFKFEEQNQEIGEGKAVFLKSDGSIILASENSPVHDQNAITLVQPQSIVATADGAAAVKEGRLMAKSMTSSQIVNQLAKKTGITKKAAGQVLAELASLAYKEAKNNFTIPGIGKLALVNRKARMGRNPRIGVSINIPAKRVVKFRVAKACKDAVLGKK